MTIELTITPSKVVLRKNKLKHYPVVRLKHEILEVKSENNCSTKNFAF